MGFPVGCTEVFFPTIFLHFLSVIEFLKRLILSLFGLLGLGLGFEFLESEAQFPPSPSPSPSPSAVLIREFLPVIQFSELAGDPPERCAVCLYEFEREDQIRWLPNCKHIFHRGCLDRWMDHDQYTCPLCRTPFLPNGMLHEFNQRLSSASGFPDFDSQFNSVFG